MSLRIGSLFSGIGGLELGLEWAGLGPVVWQVEEEPFCREILEKHWPDAIRFDDVCTVGSNNLPPVDILCGGFPCQDLSYAGKGAGLGGARSGLWREYARIVGELRPRVVVVENVAALLGRGVDRVLGDLAALGYHALWLDLRASDVGAPHRRERLFIVAWDRGRGRNVADAGRDECPNQGGPGNVAGKARTEQGRDSACHGGAVVADASGRQNSDGQSKSFVGGIPDGLPFGLDGRWPSLPCEPQREWEAPRVAQGISKRSANLTALGNAVVPQVAYVIGCVVQKILEEKGV